MNTIFPKSYSYKQSITVMLGCIIFFGLCGIVVAHKASENEQGLILNEIIKFSERRADIFYWSLVVCSMSFVAIGIYSIFDSLRATLALEVSETEVKIPKGFGKKSHVTILIEEITNISETRVSGQCFLNLSAHNQKVAISKSMMPSKESYEEVKGLLCETIEILKTSKIEQE